MEQIELLNKSAALLIRMFNSLGGGATAKEHSRLRSNRSITEAHGVDDSKILETLTTTASSNETEFNTNPRKSCLALAFALLTSKDSDAFRNNPRYGTLSAEECETWAAIVGQITQSGYTDHMLFDHNVTTADDVLWDVRQALGEFKDSPVLRLTDYLVQLYAEARLCSLKLEQSAQNATVSPEQQMYLGYADMITKAQDEKNMHLALMSSITSSRDAVCTCGHCNKQFSAQNILFAKCDPPTAASNTCLNNLQKWCLDHSTKLDDATIKELSKRGVAQPLECPNCHYVNIVSIPFLFLLQKGIVLSSSIANNPRVISYYSAEIAERGYDAIYDELKRSQAQTDMIDQDILDRYSQIFRNGMYPKVESAAATLEDLQLDLNELCSQSAYTRYLTELRLVANERILDSTQECSTRYLRTLLSKLYSANVGHSFEDFLVYLYETGNKPFCDLLPDAIAFADSISHQCAAELLGRVYRSNRLGTPLAGYVDEPLCTDVFNSVFDTINVKRGDFAEAGKQAEKFASDAQLYWDSIFKQGGKADALISSLNDYICDMFQLPQETTATIADIANSAAKGIPSAITGISAVHSRPDWLDAVMCSGVGQMLSQVLYESYRLFLFITVLANRHAIMTNVYKAFSKTAWTAPINQILGGLGAKKVKSTNTKEEAFIRLVAAACSADCDRVVAYTGISKRELLKIPAPVLPSRDSFSSVRYDTLIDGLGFGVLSQFNTDAAISMRIIEGVEEDADISRCNALANIAADVYCIVSRYSDRVEQVREELSQAEKFLSTE